MVLAAALLVALASPEVSAESAPKEVVATNAVVTANRDQLLVVHDSVLLGARDEIEAAFAGSRVDYVGFVGLSAGPAADIISERPGLVGDRVVIHLGTNYVESRSSFRTRLDRLMGLLVDVDHVLWLTASRYRPEIDEVNAEIRAAARRYPNLQIGEWGPLSDQNPSYTWTDGIHVPSAGAEAVAELIRSHLEGEVAWNRIPSGRMTRVRDGRRQLTIGGWAVDPDLDRAARVLLSIDGKIVARKRTNEPRPDNAASVDAPVADIGFTFRLDLPDGRHRICLAVNNLDGLAPVNVDCRIVNLAHSPIGQVERIVAKADGDVVRGWARDPDRARPVVVQVRAGGPRGEIVASGRADRRNDGFAIKLPPDTGKYCVVARNVLAGVHDTVLGCR